MSRASPAHYRQSMAPRTERTKVVQVRLTPEELEAMHLLAADGDESVSRLLRRLAREEADRRAEKATASGPR